MAASGGVNGARWAARGSWLVVCAAVAALGIFQRIPSIAPAPGAMLALALFAAVTSLGLGLGGRLAAPPERGEVRREAGIGAFAALVVLLALAVAGVTGNRGRDTRLQAAAAMARAGAAAPTEARGWYGAADVGGVRLFAVEVDPAGSLGRAVTGNFAGPFTLLVVGVDNHRASPITLDLGGASLRLRGGGTVALLDRTRVLSTARASREEVNRRHGAPYVVPAGASIGNAMAFVPRQVALSDVAALSVLLDGQPVMVPGAVLSVEQKRALASQIGSDRR
jgi:hypothetical protein